MTKEEVNYRKAEENEVKCGSCYHQERYYTGDGFYSEATGKCWKLTGDNAIDYNMTCSEVVKR